MDMPPSCKQLHQVMELPVDVIAHSHRAVDRLHIRLLDKNLLHLDFFSTIQLVHLYST
jgi:hypothetical protein